MKIVHEWPPNIVDIRAKFPVKAGVLFAYGDTIYHPSGTKLPRAIIAHEEVHQSQQGNDVDEWWARYLVSPSFRLKMELEAHRVEYRVMLEDAPNRSFRRLALSHVAKKLSAPLYGGLITFQRARAALKADT